MALGRELRFILSGDDAGLTRAFARAGLGSDNLSRQVAASNEKIIASMGATKRAALTLGTTMEGVSAGFTRHGKSMETFAAKTRALSLPILAAGAASAKLALDFETSMTKIGSLAGASKRDMESYRASILRMAKDTGKAPKELADGLFFVVSAGLKGKQALDALRESAKASAAGLGDTKTIAGVVTSAMKDYSSSHLSAAKATDVLVASVTQGKLAPEELAGALAKVLPIASKLGVSFDQVGASVALMSRAGLDASTSSTALRGFLAGIYNPTKKATDALKQMGTSAGEMRKEIKEKGLLAAMQDLSHRAKASGTSISAFIPNIRAATGFMSIMGQKGSEAAGVFDKVAHSAGKTESAFKQFEASHKGQLEKALTNLQIVGIKLGVEVLPKLTPAITTIARVVGHLADGFQSLPGWVKTAGVEMLAFAAIVSPLAKTVGALSRGVGFLTGGKLLRGAALGGAGAGAAGAEAAVVAGGATAAASAGRLARLGGFARAAASRVALPVAAGVLADSLLKQTALKRYSGKPGYSNLFHDVFGGKSQQDKIEAFAKTADKTAAAMRRMGDTVGLHKLAQQAREFNQQAPDLTKGFKDAAGSYDAMATAIAHSGVRQALKATADTAHLSMASITKVTHQGADTIKQELGSKSAEAKAALTQNFQLAVKSIRVAMRDGSTSTQSGMNQIRSYMTQELALYGVTGRFAKEYATGTDKRAPGAGHAIGGWVGSRGQAGRDTVPAMLGVGEAVLNRHQQAPVEHALRKTFGVGLDGLFARIKRPHFMASGGRVPSPHMQGGLGAVTQVGQGAIDRDHDAAQRLLSHAIAKAASAASGGGGASSTTGLVPQVVRALAYAKGHGWSGTVTSGFRSFADQTRLWNNRASNPNPVAQPGHSNHEGGRAVDVSDIPGFQRAMASAPPQSRLRWFGPADPVHFSVDGRAKGGFVGMSGGGFVSFAGGGRVGKAEIENLWTRAGGSPRVANLAAAVALAESGGNPGAAGHNTDGSIDRGLWQINSVHGALSTFGELANARAAVNISSHGRNWHPWVTFNTGAYRKFLAGGPSAGSLGKGGGGGSSAPSAADVQAAGEHAGSRLINKIAGPLFRGTRGVPGITGLTRLAAERDRVFGEADTAYGQVERKQGQSDEDLGTAAGRAHRTSELAALKALKVAQMKRQQVRAKALQGAISRYETLVKKLQGTLKGKHRVKGAEAARIHVRLKAYDDEMIGLKAELKALGFAITDTTLDIGDIDKEASDVAGTPDTPADAGPSATDKVSSDMDLVDLRERAGVYTHDQAASERKRILTAALSGSYGALDERQSLQLQGDLRDAQNAATQALVDSTAAITDLKKSIDANTAFAQSVVSTENGVLVKGLADMIGGQIAGFGITGRALMPGGSGALARY